LRLAGYHIDFIKPWTFKLINFDSIGVKYAPSKQARCGPTSWLEIYNSLFVCTVVYSINSSFKINVYLSKNQIACQSSWLFYGYNFIIVFVEIICVPKLDDVHLASASSYSEFWLSMKKSTDFIPFALLKICWYWRMMAYLFRYKSKILCYQLISLPKYRIEWFFCSIFVSTHWRYVVWNREGKSFKTIIGLCCFLNNVFLDVDGLCTFLERGQRLWKNDWKWNFCQILTYELTYQTPYTNHFIFRS